MRLMNSFGLFVVSKMNKCLRMMESIIITKRGNVVKFWMLWSGSVGVRQHITWGGGWRQGRGHMRLQGVAVHLWWGCRGGCTRVEDILCWGWGQWRQLGRIAGVPPAKIYASIIATQRSRTAGGVRIAHLMTLTGWSIVTLSVSSLRNVWTLVRPGHCSRLVHRLLIMVTRYGRKTFDDIFRGDTI